MCSVTQLESRDNYSLFYLHWPKSNRFNLQGGTVKSIKGRKKEKKKRKNLSIGKGN